MATALESPKTNDGGGIPDQAVAPPTFSFGALVSCWQFGRTFKFTLQRFINGVTAEIKSILTGEVFQVATTQLAPWGGSL